MWENNNYCWEVHCKNNWFHRRRNIFYKHRIPLAETDAYEALPALQSEFQVRCDECLKEYSYKPSEVFKFEQEVPESFTPHPVFQLDVRTSAEEVASQTVNEPVCAAERRRSRRSSLDAGLVVRGVSFEKGPFQEGAITISINAHGALVLMTSKVALGQTLFLKNSVSQNELQVRVVRIDPHSDGVTQVGVEFAQPSFRFWLAAPSTNLQTSMEAESGTPLHRLALTCAR
jgi:hypothetical protein